MGRTAIRARRPLADPPKTYAEAAYHRLRTDIRSGTLTPGTKLRLAHLGEEYGFGFSPIREALFRLSAEYLVTTEGQRGFRVAPISLPDFLQIVELRAELEHQALKESIGNGDDTWEASVVTSMHMMRKAPPIWKTDEPKLVEQRQRRHHDFHSALLSACRSAWRLRFWNLLQAQMERYHRIILFKVALPKKAARSIEQDHQEIMEAALDRDLDATISRLRAHDNWSLDMVKKELIDQS